MRKSILLISSEYPPMPGGIGNHAFSLAREFAEIGHDVSVLTEIREEQQDDWRVFIGKNPDIEVVGVRRYPILAITYFLRIFHAFRLLWSRDRHAVIFSGRFSVWLNAFLPKSRSIVVIHGSEILQKGVARMLFLRGLKRAAFVVCVSEFTRERLLTVYAELRSDKVFKINNGIRNEWVTPKLDLKTASSNQVSLVTVGGIHARKGQKNVVNALPLILKHYPNTKYHIVGLPVEKDRLLEIIHSHNLHDHVEFHHGLSDVQVRNLLAKSDVFLMLSDHLENGDFEGFGIATVEAMALGVPAIGSKNSGIADAISAGRSGRLVDPSDTFEITDALKEIMNNYAEYSSNAKESATRSQWKYRVQEYCSLIDRL